LGVLRGVRGNAPDTLSARRCVLNYFYVVVNKSSRLSVVDYQITKINGFLKKGWRKGARRARGKPVKRVNRASLRRPFGISLYLGLHTAD
jgi:hypothetical protein